MFTTDKLTKAIDGRVSWTAVREAFGKTAVAVDSQMTYLLRFPGQWEDGAVGFAQNRFREYPSSGRYLSRDPKGLIQGFNVYQYVGGNPISRHDRLGLCYSESRANNNCSKFNFGSYYFRSAGSPTDVVDLDSAGLLQDLRLGQIGRLEAAAFSLFYRHLYHGLISQRKGKNCGRDGNVNYTLDLGKGYDQDYNVEGESDCAFILGNGRLFVKGYCFGTLNCDFGIREHGYNGFCYANFYINDRYEDACDVADVIPGNQDFGTPCRITANWHAFKSFP